MSLLSAERLIRLRSGAAVAVAAGLMTAGLASPAFADDDPPQTDQLWINPPYEQTLPTAVDGGQPQSRTLGIGLYHDNKNFTVTDGRLVVDVSDLAGVAEVTWPANCTPGGTGAVCDVPVVPDIGDFEDQVFLTVRAADGAEVGATGRITYEATATGGPDGTLTAPQESFDTTLTVGAGPDLAIDPVSGIEKGRPGDERTIPFKVTNNGNESANGFSVELYASYGLTDLTRYDACVYTTTAGDDYAPSNKASCRFDQVLAPGDSFELPEPLTVRLAPQALNERLDIDVEPGGGAQDIDSDNDYVALQIGADNTADFSVTGDAVSARAGRRPGPRSRSRTTDRPGSGTSAPATRSPWFGWSCPRAPRSPTRRPAATRAPSKAATTRSGRAPRATTAACGTGSWRTPGARSRSPCASTPWCPARPAR
ncbi:hypothetical protein SHKM778_38470 [Streptomyces sp. KM77-8]|uniref:CARDB domain-containing protein n=1 Tax=Streptomyces haneummycinicus TaxID=3074435 RepID=A0AAT9HJ57_9ACTN